ncbi:Cytochrome bo(3) ubiquinol oxidase subunit 2 precursor [Candidatus Liberibacter asiaticus]|nr:Cytochrome bo(3) ubiquinol oxidase subunit 2 precursor [Candidatus Liberibacter asiaticus]KAE9511084.1 Cytochrome bo(3) ubiquinol oxidase subunit 2 precursor [Candidatus Liberibacter asiaticus]KAE9512447.1 Cytochrome bo(3) ubiquinol oxidase subunit 2 precursor [Candidatus Liberibacter asiaticus]KAE9513527.1 Cytochrome bo(3) ubiquinol oxidase subunit 2 precursor [Candidatus Liberibacter asiaticus]KAE9514673.1 Cytochrome bo(3) ubiquinol oxidase subunit 2 precursor [Candidatus Liberibacter asia
MGKSLKFFFLFFSSVMLSGFEFIVMDPYGDIALQQASLIRIAVALMLLIVVPVFFSILFFAWKYRSTNKKARYDPKWCHSTLLELFVWLVPLVIVGFLAVITWDATHRMDPYAPLERISESKSIAKNSKPLVVEVVALDWKWLFLLPEQQVAIINELVVPIDRPLEFRITASSVMNSFYIPGLAGQIYAMAGMETKLHAVMNKKGAYSGFSANYSGRGFSHMRFKFYGKSEKGFEDWISKVKRQGTFLNRQEYLLLKKPSERDSVRYFSPIEKGLYYSILNLCVHPGKICMDEMMRIDALGGGGMRGIDRHSLIYDEGYRQ